LESDVVTNSGLQDPKNRPTAAEALEAIIEPKALSQLPCSTPAGIFTAVATGYWKRDKRLSKDIRDAMAALRQMEDMVIDDKEMTDCMPRFMELIRVRGRRLSPDPPLCSTVSAGGWRWARLARACAVRS